MRYHNLFFFGDLVPLWHSFRSDQPNQYTPAAPAY